MEKDMVTVIHGDAYDIMPSFDQGSIDHVVTDPGYGIGITKNEPTSLRPRWDRDRAAFDPALWAAVQRVTKPGGNLLAFGHPRTYHRLVCAIEDGGWEIVDTLTWIHGQGLVTRPRWLDAELNRVGADPDLAASYKGFATTLRPAQELIVLARNVQGWPPSIPEKIRDGGSGSFNVDALRVPTDDDRVRSHGRVSEDAVWRIQRPAGAQSTPHPGGRYPSNVILSHGHACTDDACTLDCPVEMIRTQGIKSRGRGEDASRFYSVLHHPKATAGERPRVGGLTHPTVKPLAVMEWLVRLVARPGQLVLDPFAGTGTTLKACRNLGVRSVGIEREAAYIPLIEHRLGGG